MANPKHLDYAKRTGDLSIVSKNYVENEHGFASWRIEDDVLHAIQVYGDGIYWKKYLMKIAKDNGCDQLMFYTKRNPEAWKRKYNARIVETIMSIVVE